MLKVRGGGETPPLSRQCCELSVKRSPFSVNRCPRRRNCSVALTRARYAHTASFRFSAFTACFFDHNHLITNTLQMKASSCKHVLKISTIIWITARCGLRQAGALFGVLPSPSAPPWSGTLCSVVFVVTPPPVGSVEVKTTAFTHKSLSNRNIARFSK